MKSFALLGTVALVALCISGAAGFTTASLGNAFPLEEEADPYRDAEVLIGEGGAGTQEPQSSNQSVFTLNLLSNYSAAVCLDGTPAAYYYRPAPANAPQDRWIVYLEGGGFCSSPENCYKRSKKALGSSKDYPSIYTEALEGPLSSNCTVNPDFCEFHVVHLMYCDGFIYTGSRAEPIHYKGHPLYFRGRENRLAMFKHMAATTSFSQATTLLLTGGSAGALATFLHADDMRDFAMKLAPGLTKVRALPLSGFFLAQPDVDWSMDLLFLTRSMMETVNATSDFLPPCVEQVAFNPGLCFFPEYTFSYSTVPTFVLNSKTDLWQVACTLLGKVSNSTLHCMGQPEAACLLPNMYSSHPFQNCSAKMMEPILWYQQAFLNRVGTVPGFHRNGGGAFITSCLTHVSAMRNSHWQGVEINGVAMNEAVSRWWNDQGNSTAVSHTYIDCTRPGKAPYSCNPTCTV